MKLPTILATTFMLVAFDCSNDSINVSLWKKAIGKFQHDYNEVSVHFEEEKMELREVEQLSKHEEIRTSLKGTQFFLISFHGIEPHWHEVGYVSVDSQEYGFVERGPYEEDQIVADTVLVQINGFLTREGTLNRREFVDLVRFVLFLRYHRWDGMRIIEKWTDIEGHNDGTLPDSIKSAIQAPSIDTKANDIVYSFYCWDAFSSYLHHVSVIYSPYELSIKSSSLGKFGSPAHI